MNYNDYATLTPKDYQILKENYEKVQSQGFNDLNEIIIKLKEQKSNLMQDDKKYLHIIPRLQEGIDSLEKIAITSTFKSKNQNWQKLNEEVITPFKNIEKKSHKERNLFANFFKKMNTLSKSTPQTRFHTIVISDTEIQSHCHSHPQNCSRQLDILRLLLLYMTIHPTCPYIHTISSVATNQLDVYISLINAN